MSQDRFMVIDQLSNNEEKQHAPSSSVSSEAIKTHFMVQMAKEYINGANGKPKINRLENIDALEQKLTETCALHAAKLNKITGTLTSHDATILGQKSYLKSYLDRSKKYSESINEMLSEFDTKTKDAIKSDLLDVILFVKYEIKTPGSYSDAISKKIAALNENLGTERLQRFLNNFSGDESLTFINIILDYINIQALDIVRARYLHSGSQVSRTEAYNDRNNGDTITLRNPETLDDEAYSISNIFTPKKGTAEQEKSLIGKIYTPIHTSSHPFVHVSWRGSSSTDTWLSDVQITPGFESYLAHEDEILKQISAAIKSAADTHGPVHLMISGHSLGASLSQTNFNSLQRALCRGIGNECDSENQEIIISIAGDIQDLTNKYNIAVIAELQYRFGDEVLSTCFKAVDAIVLDRSCIASMHVSTFNAPGVIDAIAQSSNECSRYLTSLARPIPQYAHFTMTHGDLVQVAGNTTILTAELGTNGALAELFYFDNGHVGAVAKSFIIPAATFVGGATGSIFAGVGMVPGAAAGAAFGTAVTGTALLKGHTEKFVELESGRVIKREDLKLHHFTSTQSKNINEIQSHSHNKSFFAKMFTKVVSKKTDMLGKRTELARKIHPLLPSNRTHAFPAEYKNFSGDQAKHVILAELKTEIASISSQTELEKFEQSLKNNDRYKILTRPQGITTYVSSLFVAPSVPSAIELNKVILEKRNSFAHIEAQQNIKTR